MHAWRRDNDHRTHSWLHIQRARVHESGRHRHGVHRQTALISVSVWLKILIRILVTRGHYGCSLHRHHGHLRGRRVDDHRGRLCARHRRRRDFNRVAIARMDHARSENLRGKLGGQSQNQKKASKPFHAGQITSVAGIGNRIICIRTKNFFTRCHPFAQLTSLLRSIYHVGQTRYSLP